MSTTQRVCLAAGVLLASSACSPPAADDDVPFEAGDPGAQSCSSPEPWQGVPVIHPGDPHRFAIDGRTWYPVGYYGDAIATTDGSYGSDLGAFIADNHELIDSLAANGLDFYRTWLHYDLLFDDSLDGGATIYPYLRTGDQPASDGSPQVDLDQFNPDFFTLLADTVDHAASRGIVVQIILMHCGAVEYDPADQRRSPLAAGNNVQGIGFSGAEEYFATSGPVFDRHRAFVERVIATVGNRPNLMWEVCNEKQSGFPEYPIPFEHTRADPFISAIGDVIRASAPHLRVGTDVPEHRTAAGHLVPQADPDIDTVHARLVEQWAMGVPIVSDNDCCPGEPEAGLVRAKSWAALTAGAHIDMFNNEIYRVDVVRNDNTWRGMRYVGLLQALIDRHCIELAGMRPADDLVASGNAWAFARDGADYIVYAPRGGIVELAGLPAGHTAVWFDPTTGTEWGAGTGPAFVAPLANDEGAPDWVLYVRAGSPPEPPQTGSCPFDGAIVGPGDNVFDVEWGTDANGAIAQIFVPHGAPNQRWRAGDDGMIRVFGDKCLTAFADADGATVGIWECDGSDSQRWSFHEDRSVTGLGGRCLQTWNDDPSSGANLTIGPCDSTTVAPWTVCGGQ